MVTSTTQGASGKNWAMSSVKKSSAMNANDESTQQKRKSSMSLKGSLCAFLLFVLLFCMMLLQSQLIGGSLQKFNLSIIALRGNEAIIHKAMHLGIRDLNLSDRLYGNETRTQNAVVHLSVSKDDEGPPCSPCVFLVWTGARALPLMYKVALNTTTKAFGRENLVIVSSVLSHVEDWYPAVWKVSARDVAAKLANAGIHNTSVWRSFLGQIQQKSHYTDFMRNALVFLYGGVYSDLDSLWIRPVPFHFPVPSGKWKGKTLLRIVEDGNRSMSGVLGGVKNSSYYRKVLESMPVNYDPKDWTGIAGVLLTRTLEECSCLDLFVEIPRSQMFGVEWKIGGRLFQRPMSDVNLLDRIMNESYQSHMYGKVTKIDRGLVPAKGSMYSELLHRLGIPVPTT